MTDTDRPDWDAIAAQHRVLPEAFAALKRDAEAMKAALVKQGAVTEAAIDAEAVALDAGADIAVKAKT